MANEISITSGISIRKGNLTVSSTSTTSQFDMAGTAGGNPGVVNVGTTEETISFGDVSPGWCEFKNLDATNYVQIGFSTGVYGFRLLPAGGKAIMRLESGATVYAKANTAACDVQIIAADI